MMGAAAVQAPREVKAHGQRQTDTLLCCIRWSARLPSIDNDEDEGLCNYSFSRESLGEI